MAPLTAGEINRFFTCPACKGYLRDPHVVICCVSTFCRDCLVRALRQPASLCPNPACQKYLGVKLTQSTRPDKQLHAIMVKLFPKVFEEERKREEAYYRERESKGIRSLAQPAGRTGGGLDVAITRGGGGGAAALPPHPPSLLGGGSSSNGSTSVVAAGGAGGRIDNALAQEMFVLCCPMEGISEELQLPPLKLPYLKLQRRTRISDLSKMVASSLGHSAAAAAGGLDPEHIEFVCKGGVQSGVHNLFFVQKTKWSRDAPPLTLHYRKKAQS